MLSNKIKHVFISHLTEDQNSVDRLSQELKRRGVKVWSPDEILPGQRWHASIATAIKEGAFFIACFSEHYSSRGKNYMNEELTIAVEEIRLRPSNRTWFIPVRLSDKSEVPDLPIGAGETLLDLQWADLFGNWQRGIDKLFRTLGVSPFTELEKYTSELTDGLLLDQWQLLSREPGILQTNTCYALTNLINKSSLENGYSKRGIQLVWGHDPFQHVIAFELPGVAEKCDLRFGHKIAIHVKDKGFIICRPSGYGINLHWSDSPAYHWVIGPPVKENTVLSAGDKFSLFSTVVKDTIVHYPRLHGVSLRWTHDCVAIGALFHRDIDDAVAKDFDTIAKNFVMYL